jgi:hypothetical protein
MDASEPRSALGYKEFFRPELHISQANFPLEVVLSQLRNRAQWEALLSQRGADAINGFIDPRSGAVTNLLESVPLVPGSGNRLAKRKADAAAVEAAVRAHIQARRGVLGIDVSQLGPARVTRVAEALWQVHIAQTYLGVVVRHARMAATISHGNLVLLGTEGWGNVRGLVATPRLSADQALDAGFDYADGRRPDDLIVRAPQLEVVPFAPPELQAGEGYGGSIGQGYAHRLAWSFVFQRGPEVPRWEVLVDAHDGELLAFQDRNQYATRRISGNVYPLTNTGICPNDDQCGVMQDRWPIPFADTGFPAPNDFTNSAGIYNYTSGIATTTLSGRFVNIDDNCGQISNSSPNGNIMLGGVNGQHNCVPGGGSPGNTAASRTAFYEVNRIAELARGFLSGNAWLNSQLTARVNLVPACSAHWTGSTIEFYRSGAGCSNTGELASLIDHEWGHGLDDNDANGVLANSAEGHADIPSNYRMEASCVGHGINTGSDQGCGMTSDGTGFNTDLGQIGQHCVTDCSGYRDSDWDKHADHTPDTALGFVCNSCVAGTGPCGRQTHCAGVPQGQAAWDLVARDLTAPPFGMSSETAFIAGNRLFYLGSGNIGLWYACACGVSSDGCGATSGYMQWLAADDDDGNIANGTPHMTALHAAFNRHGIACNTPAPVNGGCSGGPTGATTLSTTPGNNSVALSWTSVPGATGYWVYRSEGHAGCNFGKTRIADIVGLSFTDAEVTNRREYYYNVVARGPSQSCFGTASNCSTVTPGGAGIVAGARTSEPLE